MSPKILLAMKRRIENILNAVLGTYDRYWKLAKTYSRKCQKVYDNIYTA